MNGFRAILLKEFAHLRRDRSTLFFALLVPALELMIFGYAINVTIENIPLAVLDLDGRQQSRRFVEAMTATRTFRVVERVQQLESLRHSISSGQARVGLIIPPNYTEKLVRREQAVVQVLIDGSDSQVAMTAMNTVGLLAGQLSMSQAKTAAEAAQFGPARGQHGEITAPIEARVRLLYNPDLLSAHFFVPGLIGIILQLVMVFLTSFSIVRERELGTLEQLFVTPVGRSALMFGKLIPYALLACGELVVVLVVMAALFDVPIHGRLSLLLGLAGLFIITALGLGLMISTVARTQLQALQLSFLVMLPSVLLSGFMFPRSEMPLPIYGISFAIPATYFIEILRGVILRGADSIDLLPSIVGLAVCCVIILTTSLTRFRKQLD